VKGLFALEVLETAYDLGIDKHAALRGIARAAADATSTGPIGVCTYDPVDGLPDVSASRFERADERYVRTFEQGARSLPRVMRQSLLALAPTVITARSEHVDGFPSHLRSSVREMILLTIMGNTGDGGSLSIALGDPKVRRWSPALVHQAGMIARHLAAAWRLRAALSPGGAVPAIAAELRTDGTASELGREASTRTARDQLRHAVLRRERARTERRSRDELDLWPALVAGQWSLVDAFTASGSRYVVAYENPPGAASLRALTEREQVVLDHVLAGRSGKRIALELGISEPTVARTFRVALRRLGAADAVVLASARKARFEPLADAGSGSTLAMARQARTAHFLAPLSSAERAIVAELMIGRSVVEVARSRGTSPRTVAHQVTSLYAKLGVASHRELVALFG
jgi:DNA-binding NarL/FixJ family response regulator